MSDNIIHAFSESNNSIWIGTYKGGLNKFDKLTNTFSSLKNNPKDMNSLSSNHITSLCADGSNLWIGTYDAGLNYYEANKIMHFVNDKANENSLSDNRITSVVKDKSGSTWVGTFNSGINKIFKDGKGNFHFNRFLSDTLFPGNISDNRISTLYIDKKGNLWAALFNNDLFFLKYGDVEFEKIKIFSSLKTESSKYRIISICDDEADNLWIGTNGAGLFRFNKITEKSFYQKFIGERIISGIVEDENQNIWLSSDKGIIKFNKDKNSSQTFDYSYGLESLQFNNNAILKTRDGEIYIGGINGFYSFYPDKILTDNSPTKTIISAVYTSSGKLALDYQVALPYNKNNITVEFSNMDFNNPSLNQYLYKLTGYDKDWQIISDGKHSAFYYNLPPGEYTFIVRGANSSGIWSTKEASLKIIIDNPFWKTWWFVILFSILVFTSASFVIYNKLRQYHEIEKLKRKLSADLHDSVGSGLTEIALLSEVMLTTETKVPESFKEKLNIIIERSNELIGSMSDIVWMVNPNIKSLYDLIIRLKDNYNPLLESMGVKFRINNIELLNDVKLTFEQRQNIYLIFKEAINNCTKYSCCKNVFLNVEMSGSKLELVLKDNGKGFDSRRIFPGNGLKNMKHRANQIKSELEVLSREGEGTEIILKCRL